MKKLDLLYIFIASVIIMLTVVIIYRNVYQCPFVFDDLPGIQEKEKIRSLSNYSSLGELLKPRGVVDFTFSVNYKFGKLDVFSYHLVNVLIHIINGLLAYFLAYTILKQLANLSEQRNSNSKSRKSKVKSPRSEVALKRGRHNEGKRASEVVLDGLPSTTDNRQSIIFLMSLATALIFVAHPVQTQAVTYIIQRSASMAAGFYMASVLFYLKARMIQQGAGSREQGGVERKPFAFRLSACFFISIICGILAFLSKQNTASLPGVILVSEYLLINRTWEEWRKKILWFGISFALWTLFVLYVAGFFTGGFEGKGLLEDVSDFMQETDSVGRWSYLCTQFNVLVIYIRLLFLPIGQNLDYAYPFSSGLFYGYTTLAFLFLIAIVGIGVWNVKKRPVITFGIFWFFITLSVESSIIPIRDAIFEHRLYLPMFGSALSISYVVFHFLSRKLSWAIIFSVIVIMCLGTATYLRNMKWKDGITLWSDVLSKSPHNTRALNNLGNSLVLQGRNKEAIGHYYDILRIEPDNVDAHINLGSLFALQRYFQRAVTHYKKALQIDPDNAKAHFNLGSALSDQGNEKEATKHFLYSLRIRPDFAEAHCKLGNILMKQGKQNRAVGHFLEAVQSKPDYTEAYNNLGIALAYMGKLDQAIIIFRKALYINPNDTWVQKNLDQALKEKARLGGQLLLPMMKK